MKIIILIISLILIISGLSAQQVPRDMVIVEIGTGGWCQYCPGAAMGADDLVANGHPVAIIENHNGDPYATGFSNYRNSYYGITGYPTAKFGGILTVNGGSNTNSMYGSYLPKVNQRAAINSSFTIDLEVESGGSGMEASITLEKVAAYTGTNLVLHFVVTESHIPYSWHGMSEFNFVSRAMVPNQYGTAIDFTSGNVQNLTLPFTFGDDWALENCEFVAFIQDNTTKEILQGTKTEFDGLLPMFTSNITEGPACLGVQFASNSLPQTGIDSWEWDFDGDGTWDSTEENPYFLYDTVGNYDVSLRVTEGAETATTTAENYITVTNSSNISGELSGVWTETYSPYIITDDVNLADENYLEIGPNVEIRTNNGSKITIEGFFNAEGAERGNILFTTDDTWSGIYFFGTPHENVLNYATITGCTQSAIDVYNSRVVIGNNTIYGNSSTSQKAPAINITNSDDVLIEWNTISNNTSTTLAGAISLDGSSPLIVRNIIVNNEAAFAGAFSMKNGSCPSLMFNTIANNLSNYAAFYLFSSSNPTIENCILIDSKDPFINYSSVPAVTYTDISGGYSGTGNIDEDPIFVNPTAGDGPAYNGLEADWSLQATSPCIDAGNPSSPPDPDGTIADMGALYYHQQVSVDGPQAPKPTIRNHPNPFTHSTTISYSIPSGNSDATITIYTIRGELVREFRITNSGSGIGGSIEWDGRNKGGKKVADGLYFYRLDAGNINSIQKMILMK